MWKDTMLIINTDHGYLLGEHGYFGKNYMPNYDQIVHTPFFLWNPKTGGAGKRCDALSQAIDIAPTLLDYFGVQKPVDMLGQSLTPVLQENSKIHEYILFGYFGKHVNITDGRYVYMRAGRSTADSLLNNYTLLPLHMFYPFTITELRKIDRKMSNEFSFTKGAPVMKIPTSGETAPDNSCYQFEDHMKYGDLLFDLKSDPNQDRPIQNSEVENRLLKAMKDLLDKNEAPKELYTRIGL
ncbi:MAG TPA: hypothetical protein DDW50_02240 [Firmicutes bacterium]|nr:hypothetical protein [Bacillota bacterium]